MRGSSEKSVQSWTAEFGPFRLSPSERLLQRDGVPVRLGGRALDLLIVLVENAGSPVSKEDLLARVWGSVVVDEGSLRFHMFAVRKALGDGEGGRRLIINTPNKGYTFVAHVDRGAIDDNKKSPAPRADTAKRLPAFSTVVIGRDKDVESVTANILQRRLVSLVGAGGIGKTTVAIAIAHEASSKFAGDAIFIDLAQLTDPILVHQAVASALGLKGRIDDLASLANHLADRKCLIVLDGCEHLILGVAELSEYLLRHCPQCHVLTTSREPLGAEGEFVYRLRPLQFPAEGEGLTAASALAYPAVRLFVDRAAISGAGFELREHDAPLVSKLCRELDGIALAIELAAGRVEAFGLESIASHLDASMKLMWHGRRTAVPRQQTLSATLDWSFHLLAEDEKQIFPRLGIFPGSFSLEAATKICGIEYDEAATVELIARLVSKSLVTVDAGGVALRYGLLDTTRAYCLKRLVARGESKDIQRRFAAYYAEWTHNCASQSLVGDAVDVASYELSNVRATLKWYFDEDALTDDAIQVTVSLCPLLLQLSQLAECSRWAQMALLRMPKKFAGTSVEAKLQGCLGQSLTFAGGDTETADKAFRRCFEVAEKIPELRKTLLPITGSYAVFLRMQGRYEDALTAALGAEKIAVELADGEAQAIVFASLGFSLHMMGRVREAFDYVQKVIERGPGSRSDVASRLGFNYFLQAHCVLARLLWLLGRYSEAQAVAEETISRAELSGNAVTHCIALLWAGSVFTYADDLERIERVAVTMGRVAKRHSFVPYINAASIIHGQMLIAAGEAGKGVEQILKAVEVLHSCKYEMITSVALTFVAQGLSSQSLYPAALATCDQVEFMIRRDGDYLRLPQLLITRGRALAAAGDRAGAEVSWLEAIRIAESQGVVSGQLRAALALASSFEETGRTKDAVALLRPYVTSAKMESSRDLITARTIVG